MSNKNYKIGRSAITGEFVSVNKARKYSNTHTVEVIKSGCSQKHKK